jgi:localization factor PodJL
MNSRRSYLESLNAGRKRRPPSSLEQLNLTLANLEGRFAAGQPAAQETEEWEEDIAQRMQRLAGQAGAVAAAPEERRAPAEPLLPQAAGDSLGTLARDLERTRMQEEGIASAGRIAGDLKALREDLRHQMTAGLRSEFEALRHDIELAYASAATGTHGAELGQELERLSDAAAALAARGDVNGINLLHRELEQVKGALDSLAREETVQSVGRRWEEFDRRWSASEQQRAAPDPALQALHTRLEQINEAVNELPESLSLHSLEDKVRGLAGAINQLLAHQEHAAPESFEMIGERLDEISRAIVASSMAAPAANLDPQPFERIEARITSLARQIQELADDRPVRQVMDGLTLLSERVDEISRRAEVPEKSVKKLAQQIAAISEKLDAGHAAEADRMLETFESRFADLSAVLERRQSEATEEGRTLFGEVENRLQELAARLEGSAPDNAALMRAIDARFAALANQLEAPGESEAIRKLEARLEDISTRLEHSARQAAGTDPELMRNLEAQVAALAAHLSRPSAPLPDFEDMGPRLDQIERSIAENRNSILTAARQAAEEAIRGFSGSKGDEDAVNGLAGDLRSLEKLARKSDERNTKTFEAIHDTLLKIVDRLGTLELRQVERNAGAQETGIDEPPARKLSLESAPPTEPDEYEPPLAADADFERSPSQAAAAAALAAVKGESLAKGERRGRKRSMLGGITRVLSSRAKAEEPLALAGDDEGEAHLQLAPEIDLDEPLDPKIANQPLEPGSGAPDLSAIMKRVRDERTPLPRGGTDAAKSDFIAAARRAAQAAAAEAEMLKKQADKKGAASPKSGLGRLLRTRKTVMVAVGAILVALAGLQLGKAFLADAGTPPQEAALVEEQQPEEIQPAASEEIAAIEPSPAVEEAAGEASAVRTIEASAAAQGTPAAPDTESAPGGAPIAAAMPENPSPSQDSEVSSAPPSTVKSPAAEIAEEEAAVAESEVDAPPLQIPEVPAEAGSLVLLEAAKGGDPKALFEIGSRYAEGRRLAQNNAEAAKWYEISAGLGFAPAQYRIGNFYEKGIGVSRDIAKAKTWYLAAAEQDNASAMHNLAVLYAMGADGAPDNEAAARWFVEAAERGITDSQFNLGILAAKGVGVPQDLQESYKWFALVAKTGDQDAAAKRDEVAKALAPEQLEKARAATELWRAKPADAQANSVDIPDTWKDGDETTAGVDMMQAVRNIQLILNKNGYDAGGADGVMGQKTKAAIAAFQKSNGMDATGEVDKQLVQALLAKR